MAPLPQSPSRHAWSQDSTTTTKPASSPSSFSDLRPLPGSRTVITHHADLDDENDRAASRLAGATAAATSGMGAMSTMVIPPSEADRLIESLVPFPVDRVGSDEFMRMYGRDLERLSLQAHLSAAAAAAAAGGDVGVGIGGIPGAGHEYVVESILTYGKMPALVRTLLAVELWRTHVLFGPPSGNNANEGERAVEDRGEAENSGSSTNRGLAPLLAKNGNVLRTAFALHVETTIVGLLTLVLYRREAFDELDSEIVVALVDYCARSMTSLAAPLPLNEMVGRQKRPAQQSAGELADRIRSRSSLDEIVDARYDAEFKTSVGATAMARYLCEHIAALPLSARSRILDTHDFLVMAVPLIDEPPWTRRRFDKDGGGAIWEKYVDGQWTEVGAADLLQVTKVEAQPWIMLFHLLCTPECRESYALDAFRKGQLLRLRKFLNDVVVDQLPVLADVMRYMDELTLMEVPESGSGGGVGGRGSGSALLLQQVDTVREELMKGTLEGGTAKTTRSGSGSADWESVAEEQYRTIFSRITDATDEELRLISDVYGEDGFEAALGVEQGGMDAVVPPTPSPPFEVTSSLPIEEFILSLSAVADGAAAPVDALRLVPAEDAPKSAVQTPHGPFHRIKLAVHRLVDGDGAQPPLPVVVPAHSTVVAKAYFGGVSRHDAATTTMLRCDDLNLPDDASAAATTAATASSKPKKVWRQLGRLEEGLVLQLGFGPVFRQDGRGATDGDNTLCYNIEQAFFSQPSLE